MKENKDCQEDKNHVPENLPRDAEKIPLDEAESKANRQDFIEVPCSKPVAPDGGWGWFCVLGSAINFLVLTLLVRSFGVTYIQLLIRYESTPTVTSWVGALNMACAGLFGPLASNLVARFSCRTVTIIGGVLTTIGVGATAFAPNIYVCCLTYGVIAGMGLCFGMTSGYIIIEAYFEKRKATAMGVACVGNAIGLMAAPPFLLYFFEKYGYQGAFIILSAMCLQACVGGALYRPLDKHFRMTTSLKHAPAAGKPRKKGKMCDMTLFLDTGFQGYFVLMTALVLVASLTSAFLPALGMEKGLSLSQSTYVLAVMGVCDIIGTVGLGAFMDLNFVRKHRVYWCAAYNFIVALTTIFNPFLSTFAEFVVISVIRGIFVIHLMAQRMTILTNLIEPRRRPAAIGIILLSNALGSLIARALAGFLRDELGSYSHTFYIIGAVSAVASVVCVACYAWKQRKREQSKPEVTVST